MEQEEAVVQGVERPYWLEEEEVWADDEADGHWSSDSEEEEEEQQIEGDKVGEADEMLADETDVANEMDIEDPADN
ncbi:hypothetical protein OE88DRAFT_1663436 [Heliocybe sulcata]|uniref:Uncharacterized protein n=1 Tax=Heliocybe sulcata TaxID=5364 RepID=A0A5C3MY21_9AGAM|nr:hypothetical protein OE88DRAFT_1663436 [Heliocybe sulcata]